MKQPPHCHLFDCFHPITLATKALFDAYLRKYPPQISELTFTNLYCWAELEHFLFCEYQDHLLISFRDQSCRLYFFPPIGPAPESIIIAGIPGLKKFYWSQIDETLAQKLADFDIRPDFDASDYVYRLDDLRVLAGRKYAAKRNMCKRIEALNPTIKNLDTSMVDDCIRIQERWLEYSERSPSVLAVGSALSKALEHFDDLDFSGIGVFVQGKMIGFAIGEALNDTTYVEHFEKGLAEYSGVYQFLLTAFAQAIPARFTLLNREQDMGIAGLRKAKMSWYPAFMTNKYHIRIAN